jgi:hypothetical protein
MAAKAESKMEEKATMAGATCPVTGASAKAACGGDKAACTAGTAASAEKSGCCSAECTGQGTMAKEGCCSGSMSESGETTAAKAICEGCEGACAAGVETKDA